RGVVRAGLLPVVSVNGLPRPDVALTAAAGIEYRSGVVTGGLFYGLERYDFPDRGAGRRLEQVSTLTIRFGARRGGDHAAHRGSDYEAHRTSDPVTARPARRTSSPRRPRSR